jgi:hypothetical protein
MSFNFAFNVGFLLQNSTRNHNAEYDPNSFLNPTTTSENIIVTTYPRWYKHIVVQWSIPADWGLCTFNVYYSPNSTGDWQRMNQAPLPGPFFTDTEEQEYSKFNNGYYIVEAILTQQGNKTIASLPSRWSTAQRDWVGLRSREIQRREFFLLAHFTGIKSYLFQRKTFGERCPNCWDCEREVVYKDNCDVCFGTSFKGGYAQAAPLMIQYDASPNSNIKTYFGKWEPNQIGAWTISVPKIQPDDILLRVGDWNLYRVEEISPTELQGNTVRQILKLTQLAKSEIENDLITQDLADFPQIYT